jgi:hypothetical protein
MDGKYDRGSFLIIKFWVNQQTNSDFKNESKLELFLFLKIIQIVLEI